MFSFTSDTSIYSYYWKLYNLAHKNEQLTKIYRPFYGDVTVCLTAVKIYFDRYFLPFDPPYYGKKR